MAQHLNDFTHFLGFSIEWRERANERLEGGGGERGGGGRVDRECEIRCGNEGVAKRSISVNRFKLFYLCLIVTSKLHHS